jgi:hypothetical protein
MSFGYIGDTSTSVKQQVKNKGILTTQESFDLERQGFLGGSLKLIAEQTYSSAVSSIQFTDIKESLYDVHLMQIFNVQGTTDQDTFTIYLYEDGIGWETASVYQWANQINSAAGAGSEQNSTSRDGMSLFGSNDNDTNEKNNAYVYFYNLGNSAKYSFSTFQTTAIDYYETGSRMGGAVLPQASKVTGIRLDISNNNFSSFTLKLFGVKQK